MRTGASGPEIVPLGPVDDVAPALRAALLHALTFDVYREHFAAARITERDVRDGEPVSVLRRAPLLESPTLSALADESIATMDDIVDVEVSSGTTGTPKRRLITATDACVETELLARLFEICGLGPGDRVACVDTGPLTLIGVLHRRSGRASASPRRTRTRCRRTPTPPSTA